MFLSGIQVFWRNIVQVPISTAFGQQLSISRTGVDRLSFYSVQESVPHSSHSRFSGADLLRRVEAPERRGVRDLLLVW